MILLSIIGIEDGDQPIFNEDKSIAVICNGEIYNYLELKIILLKRTQVLYKKRINLYEYGLM